MSADSFSLVPLSLRQGCLLPLSLLCFHTLKTVSHRPATSTHRELLPPTPSRLPTLCHHTSGAPGPTKGDVTHQGLSTLEPTTADHSLWVFAQVPRKASPLVQPNRGIVFSWTEDPSPPFLSDETAAERLFQGQGS